MVSVAMALKRLRESATPEVSIRQMAAALGIDHSTYAHYENPARFKKPRLEIDLARRVARVLADHGIDPEEVMALAGVREGEHPPMFSAAQEEWLALFDRLSARQRKLLLDTAREMLPDDAVDELPVGGTLHSPGRSFTHDEAVR